VAAARASRFATRSHPTPLNRPAIPRPSITDYRSLRLASAGVPESFKQPTPERDHSGPLAVAGMTLDAYLPEKLLPSTWSPVFQRGNG
jgi:hypothetical protein